jgi:hypothetical protein
VKPNPADVEPIVAQIHALLAGLPSPIQGGVLADLLAIFLAGHIIPGNSAATDAMRKRLLKLHIATVRQLIPVNAAEITERMRRGHG